MANKIKAIDKKTLRVKREAAEIEKINNEEKRRA